MVLVTYHFSFIANNNHVAMRLLVDGAEKPEARSIWKNEYGSSDGMWVGELTKGSHTFKVQYVSSYPVPPCVKWMCNEGVRT